MGNNVTKESRDCKSCSDKFLPKSNSQKLCQNCRFSKCTFCNKEFIVTRNRKSSGGSGKYLGKYCSMSCYHKSRWGNGSNKCQSCEKPLSKEQARFCSSNCQKDFWNKKGYHLGAKQRIWKRKLLIIEKLGGKCIKCGIDDVRVLDINHIDRDQKKRPLKRVYSWTRRLKEWEQNMKNIELLCANCHRKHTWEQMGYGVGLDKEYFEIATKRINETTL